jgi:hypothetical protein
MNSYKLCIKTIYEMYMSDNPKKIVIDQNNEIKLGKSQFQKMVFIMNALDKGWSIKKQQDKYIFTKKHENKREIFEENYLERFIISNSTEQCFLDN